MSGNLTAVSELTKSQGCISEKSCQLLASPVFSRLLWATLYRPFSGFFCYEHFCRICTDVRSVDLL